MLKTIASNTLLLFGIIMLTAFAALELFGWQTDPLLPAFAAFCIGCTAVLDRVGLERIR
jgi:hypothetical protein